MAMTIDVEHLGGTPRGDRRRARRRARRLELRAGDRHRPGRLRRRLAGPRPRLLGAHVHGQLRPVRAALGGADHARRDAARSRGRLGRAPRRSGTTTTPRRRTSGSPPPRSRSPASSSGPGMTQLFGDRRRPRRGRRRAPGSLSDDLDADVVERRSGARPLERELQVAQRIQRTLVLLAGVEADGWEIASDYRPARSIGGDFFDVFPILDPARPRHLGVVIADVSGKGISAAMLMAFVRPVIALGARSDGRPGRGPRADEPHPRRRAPDRPVRHGPRRRARPRHRACSRSRTRATRCRSWPARRLGAALDPGGGPLLGVFGRLDLTPQSVEIRPGRPARPLHGRHHRRRRRRRRTGIGERATAADRQRYPRRAGRRHVPRRHRRVLAFQGDALPADDLAFLVFRRLPVDGACTDQCGRPCQPPPVGEVPSLR